MKIRDLIKVDPGFQYVIDQVELMSAAGRRRMLDTNFMVRPEAVEAEWERLSRAVAIVEQLPVPHAYVNLRHCFMQLHDLQSTLGSLASRTVLNEVELFELKNLSFLVGKARDALTAMGLTDVLPLPDLSGVFALLDPDRTGVVNFYIYDSYHPRLAPLRAELRGLQQSDGDPQRISDLLAEQGSIQQEVCLHLCDELFPFASSLTDAMEQMAYGDLLFARAELCKRWRLVRPSIAAATAYRQIVNPRLRDRNEAAGLRYQPVDIALTEGVTLITGANMAGKTVLLKSVGTAQLMAQTGLFVAAEAAEVALVEDVVTSIGDEQNEMNGLSSYASEMLKISTIVQRARAERLLILIDEPARTTNPTEGKALVQALIALLEKSGSFSLITTHYGQLGATCRRLRVRGFVEDMASVPLSPKTINLFVDYSLAEDSSDDVPHEALRIAEIMQCDAALLAEARRMLQ